MKRAGFWPRECGRLGNLIWFVVLAAAAGPWLHSGHLVLEWVGLSLQGWGWWCLAVGCGAMRWRRREEPTP